MFVKFATLILIFAVFYQLFFTNNLSYFKNYFSKLEEGNKFPICYAAVFMDYDLEASKHLSILGHVFDVSSKPEVYGTNGSYHFFTGIH